MTRASEELNDTNEPQTEQKAKRNSKIITKRPAASAWTEEEEQTLTELLKIHKWQEWNAIAAKLGKRTAGGVEARVRKAGYVADTSDLSIVKKELCEIAQMRKKEYDLIKETGIKADILPENNEAESNSEDKLNEERLITEQANTQIAEETVVQDEKIGTEVSEPVITESINAAEPLTEAVEVPETVLAETVENVINPVESPEAESSSVETKLSEPDDSTVSSVPEPIAESVPETNDTESLEIQPQASAEIEYVKEELISETVTNESENTTTGDVEMEPVTAETTENTNVPETIVTESFNEITDIVTESNPIEAADVAMEEVTNTETSNTDNVIDSTTETKLVRKGRKPRNTTQAAPIKSPKKSSAKSPVKAVVTKRTYTRKIKPVTTPVNSGEEISILSSSDSAGSSKESINIMSSSNSNESIPSLPSVPSIPSVKSGRSTRSARSVKSEDSIKSAKSENSIKSVKSNKSAKSVKSTKCTKSNKSVESDKSTESNTVSDKSEVSTKSKDSVASVVSETDIPAWEREACSAIFEKTSLKNPVNRYKALKKRIENILKKNPETNVKDIIEKNPEFNAKAIEQVYNVVKGKEDNLVVPVKQTENEIAEDLKILKKMSLTSSGRKRKIRSEEGDWIDPNEIEGRVIAHEPIKEKRKKRIVKKVNVDEDLNTTEDPFRLILLHEFDDQSRESQPGQVDENGDEIELVKAPFKVEICNSVILLMDLHSHLHSSEIIGLLGGVFVKSESTEAGDNLPILRINYVFPCSTAHSTGTQVDVDPLSEMEAGDYFEANGVRMAGWYHSHPNFEPNPSLRDLETQTMYQGLFKNSEPDSNIEPFVGVIVNPYMTITESSSHIECFYVVPTADPTQERLPYRLPIERTPFDPQTFPQILQKMREIVFKAESSADRLDMRKNAQPGVKRIEKLFASLQSHGNLSEDQMTEIKILFN